MGTGSPKVLTVIFISDMGRQSNKLCLYLTDYGCGSSSHEGMLAPSG